MITRPIRASLLFCVLMSVCAPLWAQTLFEIGPGPQRRVHEFPLGAGYRYQNHPVYAGRGFHYDESYYQLYLVNVLPGSYSLQLSYPRGNINLKPAVTIFDRWPYDARARRFDLPMGPMAAGSAKKIEYRWNLGIAPESTSTLLYIAVELPTDAHGRKFFPHEINVLHPSSPMFTLKRGITFLSGPEQLVLTSTQSALAYAVERNEPSFDPQALPSLPIPGDLVRNGNFAEGLNYWLPQRERVAREDSRSFALSEGMLKIRSEQDSTREGVMQRIDTAVRDAAALVLMADVMVKQQTQGGLGAHGTDAPIAVAVGYTDATATENGKEHVFWKGFYSLKAEDARNYPDGQQVPQGVWYRIIIDLMQLDPKPARINFISLEGSGWPAREGRIRNVHLIKSGGKK